MTMRTAIRTEGLTKHFGDVRALVDLDLDVLAGEVFGFLGPNGAGKTTTMRMLTGFLPPDSGTATVAGFDVRRQPLEVRRRIGYLPESAPLYEDMGTIDYLRYVAGMRGLSRDRTRRAVSRVVSTCGLGPAVGKKIGQLSKGYRQRVGLAQAMIHEPDILILDEPTSGLDPNQIIEIRNLIREIGREKTIILSTHILPEVSATCGRVVIIARGTLVGSGTPEELTSRARSGQGVSLVVRGPGDEIEIGLRDLPVVSAVDFVQAEADALRYRVSAGNGVEPAALAEAVSGLAAGRGWALRELAPQGATLEDVFRELTTREGDGA